MNDKIKTYKTRNIYTDKGEEDEIYVGEIDNIQEIKDNEEFLINLKKRNKPQFFKYYSQLYIELSKKGKITRQTAAYIISGWMFDSELKGIPEIKEIVMFASCLEVPYHIATDQGDKHAYDMEWNKLVDKINNLQY